MSLAEKIVVDPFLEIVCALCGRNMEIIDDSPYLNWRRIQIEVCEECGDYDRGYEKGSEEAAEEVEAVRTQSHDEGYDGGYDAGYDKGREGTLETYDKGYEEGFAAANKEDEEICKDAWDAAYEKGYKAAFEVGQILLTKKGATLHKKLREEAKAEARKKMPRRKTKKAAQEASD